MEKLITKRLGIRNMTDADLVFIKSLRADEVCARYQRWEDNSEEHIREMIATHRHDVLLSDTEIQRFLIAMRDGAPVGTLTLFVTPDEDCITVGITIASAHQRKGYAKELLTALCNLAKETYPTLDLITLIHPDNTPSIRLFEALGFRFQLHAESINSLVYVR
jgi:RimJ/RimL family protein N-acetyltransferase